jgi:FixJ family two-component response regulator
MIQSLRDAASNRLIPFEDLPDHRPDPLRELEDREYLDHITAGLSRKERRVLEARAEGRSLDWIALNLGVSRPTANEIRKQAQAKCLKAATSKPKRGTTRR